MKKRRELVPPGVVVGFFASLLAYDLRCARESTERFVVLFWLGGVLMPYIGCWWVGLKHRIEGRRVGRSAWITFVMGCISGALCGAISSAFICPVLLPLYAVFGSAYGAPITAIFILPPTLWVAMISMNGFRRTRAGSFARTIWWRRRWHATIAACSGALAVRLWMAPATPYALGLSAAVALIAGFCSVSLLSMSSELAALTAGVAAVAGRSGERAPSLDLGIGDEVALMVVSSGAGPYRATERVERRVVGDLGRVKAMMRHTLWGVLALLVFSLGIVLAASQSLLHAH
jgi:hypothetical protein